MTSGFLPKPVCTFTASAAIAISLQDQVRVAQNALVASVGHQVQDLVGRQVQMWVAGIDQHVSLGYVAFLGPSSDRMPILPVGGVLPGDAWTRRRVGADHAYSGSLVQALESEPVSSPDRRTRDHPSLDPATVIAILALVVTLLTTQTEVLKNAGRDAEAVAHLARAAWHGLSLFLERYGRAL